jgi:hypothetical protein
MGAIFPMAPLSTRMGFVKKREKEARRSAQQAQRDYVPLPDQGAHLTSAPRQAGSSQPAATAQPSPYARGEAKG